MISDQTRRKKSREVSSRYLSTTGAPPLVLNNNHINTLSPNCHNPSPQLKPKHKNTGFIRGLWPSSASKSSNNNKPITTSTSLPNHFDNDRKKLGENSPVLSKQKSWSEFRHSKTKSIPFFGGSSSMRFTGKHIFPGRPSVSSSSMKSSDSNQVILPGRLSVDENALRRRSSYYQMKSDSFSDNSETSDLSSPFTPGRNSPAVSYDMTPPTLSCKKPGIHGTSKYMIIPSVSMQDDSPKNSTIKTTMKRAHSLSSPSEWESSPSRLGSPSFSSSKPPNSSRFKKNLLHIGLDLIKGKKGGSKMHSPLASDMENVHQLRVLHNSWMQWRYTNARAQHLLHENLTAQSENMLSCGYESVAKLRQSVLQKRLQLQKEKQEMKLNLILHSQTKMLEAWGDIERRHMLDVSVMKDYLHAVVCMIPLIEGAKVDIESTTTAFQQTSNLVATIKSMLSSVSTSTDEPMVTLSELAEVVTQEKLLLEECFEHLRVNSTLEVTSYN
ncbi:hypothetical protein R6Q59_004645 [Mikania micrantha]|uniref:QWRF motif-containing protein 3 n=1 Tax=Mikania micrantha TaxID=192012 RepID=A0A5N6MPC9_9ASTR|nr:hypothetical protein E3N88_31247 [Mikania micrantha]